MARELIVGLTRVDLGGMCVFLMSESIRKRKTTKFATWFTLCVACQKKFPPVEVCQTGFLRAILPLPNPNLPTRVERDAICKCHCGSVWVPRRRRGAAALEGEDEEACRGAAAPERVEGGSAVGLEEEEEGCRGARGEGLCRGGPGVCVHRGLGSVGSREE